MKAKVSKILLIALLIGSATVTNALKVRKATTTTLKAATKIADAKEKDVAADSSGVQETPVESVKKAEGINKEVHKRGIFHGNLFAGHPTAAYWPRPYAAHYGYSLHSPTSTVFASSLAAPTLLKYPYGTHYKAHAFAAAPAFSGFPSPLPAAAVYPHIHEPAAAPVFPAAALPPATTALAAAPPVAAATPYVIRPGGAVVSSYNVNYPQHYIHKPVVPVAQPTYQAVLPPPLPAPVPAIQPVQSIIPTAFRPAVPVVQQPPIVFRPPQPALSVVPAATPAIQPPHFLFRPAQPVQPAPAVPVFSSLPPPSPPILSFIPQIPDAPAPAVPVVPQIPTVPALPAIPATPAVPTVPVFTIGVQPPKPTSQPPTFISVPIIPEARPQVPLRPIPGNPPPDTGSAVASPQIPPNPAPQPEFPPATESSWKPMAHRPSVTLLPPYGAPTEGYLPPAPPSSSQLQEQQYSNSIFDNLSDAEIEHIFSQASLAAQQSQHHNHHYQQSHQHRDTHVYQHY